MPSIHLKNKKIVYEQLNRLVNRPREIQKNLSTLYHPQSNWRGSHPFNELQGIASIGKYFWEPLLKSFPDLERRDLLFLSNEFQGDPFVGAVGHYCGTFKESWLDIPPTGKTVYLRYGEFHKFKEGKIIESTVLIDILDFIRQAGYWPLSPSLGREGRWEGPLSGDGLHFKESDPKESKRNLNFTLDMHRCLNTYDDSVKNSRDDLLNMDQKNYWHSKMMWYGPSGIGTARGLQGFVDYHQCPFRLAFPNRKAIGHYVRIGDGRFTATSGWPSLEGHHLGGGWLGTSPTGRKITMRVMDFYSIDEGLLRENWVPVDIVDILLQMGVDVLERVYSLIYSKG